MSPLLYGLDLVVFVTITALFFIVLIAVKKRMISSNMLESLAMGRSLTLPAFVITLVSSWYGGVLGATQIAYKYGIYNFVVLGVFWYGSALLFALLIARKFIHSGAISLPEIIGKAYGKKCERIILMLMLVKGLPIAYIMALSMLISHLLGISTATALCISGIFAACIGARSSLRGVAIIDTIQFCTIFIGMGATIYFCITNLGGVDYLLDKLPANHLTAQGANSWSKLALWLLAALSTTFLSPIFHQRCSAAKNSKTAQRGIVISVVFWLFSDILTTAGGLYARAYLGEGHDNSAYLDLLRQVLPAGLCGYMLATLVIAAISAVDSYMFAAKSLLLNHQRIFSKATSYKYRFMLSSGIAVVATILAASLHQDIEIAWLLFKSAFIASTLIPMLVAIHRPTLLSSQQFYSIVAITFCATLIGEYYFLAHNTTCNLVALAVNASLVSVCAIYRLYLRQVF